MSHPLHLLLSSAEKYLVKSVNFKVPHLHFNVSWEILRETCDVGFWGQKSRNLVTFKCSSVVRCDAVL